MARVEVFADIVCPFTHVGLRRLSEARRGQAVPLPVRVRAWPLELINGAAMDPDLAAREIDALRAKVAPGLFGGFDVATFPRTAIGEAVSLAIRDALFEQGSDVSDDEVLRAIGGRFGVEPLSLRAAEAAARADWERGRARAVQGSPHFFVGERGWFCPSLDISHHGEQFEVRVGGDTMRDFYAAALA